ncbi:serine/threonine-protein kinase [Streptomyces antnestii]|uniref:Serine/threonine-protein kinase n=1 Tax=Streptomyces antnestii TaxID=2494256 RepID=A0A3S2Z0I0_9ACTN|nr:serine/threonine-protein kinase [Streptomyces sp. San01]RVU24483.1 serine/threonine-protein kinase [Streptomyces sp. San01]
MKPLGTGDPVRLGPYRLLGVLGEGGMGKVYVGQDDAGTLAAVKVLRPELAHDTHLAQRFIREAQAAQAVRSPGIAAVLGAQTEGGRPWIATEFLAGPTLDQAVDAHGPLGEAAVRALAASLARTLADIHAAGFIHRDLKPPNIVLTSSGPRIIDFGIARPEHGLTLTITGQVPVTPGYGAPEQVLGQRVSPPADVFSLGAVLVYAAGGRPAYSGGHVAAVQYEVVHGDPQLDGISPQLRTLIAPCLAKDSAARPTPGQITAAFEEPGSAARQVWRRGPVAEAIKEREAGARQLTTQVPPAAAPDLTRRRLITGFAAGGAVLAAGGGGTAWWLGAQKKREVEQSKDPFYAPPPVRTPKATLDTGAGGKPTSLWKAAGVMDGAHGGLLPVRDVLVFASLKGGFAAHDVRSGKRRWAVPEAQVKAGCLSLSDQLIAMSDGQGALRTFVASTGRPKWTCPAAGAKALVAADDQSVYILTGDDRLRSISRTDAKIRWTSEFPAEYREKVQHRAVIDDGLLVFVGDGGGILTMATADGHPVWSFPQKTDLDIYPAVHKGIVYLNGEPLTARRLRDGKKLWESEPSYRLGAKAWGPPLVYGDSIYANDGDHTRRILMKDGSEVWSTLGEASYFSPVLRQGGGLWAYLYREDSAQVSTMNIEDGKATWAYGLPKTDYLDVAADGNRVFVQHDSSITALSVF